MQNATATSIAGQTPSTKWPHPRPLTPTFPACLISNNVATILGKLLLACAPLADGQTAPQLLLKAAPPSVPPPSLAALLAVICLPYLLPSLNSTHQALLAAQLQVNCRNVCQSISQILRYFSCEAGKRYDAKCQYSCCQFTHTLCVCVSVLGID